MRYTFIALWRGTYTHILPYVNLGTWLFFLYIYNFLKIYVSSTFQMYSFLSFFLQLHLYSSIL